MIVKNILTDSAVKDARPMSKPLQVASDNGSSSETAPALTVPIDKNYKLSDGGGLSLVVNPNGSKWWHFRYRFNGKEGQISLGVYPKIAVAPAVRAEFSGF